MRDASRGPRRQGRRRVVPILAEGDGASGGRSWSGVSPSCVPRWRSVVAATGRWRRRLFEAGRGDDRVADHLGPRAMASVRSMACCRAALPPRIPGRTRTATAAGSRRRAARCRGHRQSAATATTVTFGRSELERTLDIARRCVEESATGEIAGTKSSPGLRLRRGCEDGVLIATTLLTAWAVRSKPCTSSCAANSGVGSLTGTPDPDASGRHSSLERPGHPRRRRRPDARWSRGAVDNKVHDQIDGVRYQRVGATSGTSRSWGSWPHTRRDVRTPWMSQRGSNTRSSLPWLMARSIRGGPRRRLNLADDDPLRGSMRSAERTNSARLGPAPSVLASRASGRLVVGVEVLEALGPISKVLDCDEALVGWDLVDQAPQGRGLPVPVPPATGMLARARTATDRKLAVGSSHTPSSTSWDCAVDVGSRGGGSSPSGDPTPAMRASKAITVPGAAVQLGLRDPSDARCDRCPRRGGDQLDEILIGSATRARGPSLPSRRLGQTRTRPDVDVPDVWVVEQWLGGRAPWMRSRTAR